VSENSFRPQNFPLSIYNTNHFSISQGWETSLPSFPSHNGTYFQTKRARRVRCHIRQNTYSTSGKVKVDAVTETNSAQRTRCQHAYYQDVMTYIVMAGIQIQYEDMYPTKTWCDAVLDLCSIYVGRMALTLTHYPSQNGSHMFFIVFVLNTLCSNGLPKPHPRGSNNQPPCIVLSPVASSTYL
jgi:hypothetical protein